MVLLSARLLEHAARSHVGFHPENRLDALVLALHGELHDTKHDAVVADCKRFHAELFSPSNHFGNLVRAVEKAVFRVVMEVAKVDCHSGVLLF